MIKIESPTNPDVARLFGSAWAGGVDPAVYRDTSPYLPEMSANKRSLGLDLKRPEAVAAALALLATADVFVTNYSTPAVLSDRVVIGGRDKFVHCLNKDTGKKIWTFRTRGKIDGSPVLCDGKVVIGSEDGRLYFLSLADGKQIWS